MRTALVGALVRLLLLTAVVWRLVTISYLPVRDQPFGDDNTEAAVRAINAGYPYRLLYRATADSPQLLRNMNEGVVDQGIEMLMTVGVTTRDWLTGSHTTVTSSMCRDALMWLFVVAAVAIVAPGVPVIVATGGMLALHTMLKWGPIGLGLAVHWGVSFAAIIAGVLVGSVLKPWTWWRIATLTVLAALAALAQILRQEAASVAYGTGIALLVSAAVVAFVRWRSRLEPSHDAELWTVARRALAGGLLLIAVNASAQPVERWCISRQMGTPYANTPAIEHGSGWPLYLSLGYVSNPFNIAWRDPIGQVHAWLIASRPVASNAAVHSMLMREYLDIVIARPWLLLQNVAAKAARVHTLATRRAPPLPDVAVWQQPVHARLYEALPWLAILCVALVWWRGTPQAAVICVAWVALAAAASAGALIVFPDYMGGVQGAIVALSLIAPAAVASHVIEAPASGRVPPMIARRILTSFAALAAGAVLIGGVFVTLQWVRYRAVQEQTAARDPLEAIVAQQFRYAHVFNDLPVARQGRLVARLTASSDPRIARTVDLRRGDLDLFRPIALVRTATQLHLICWMGSSFQPPFPPFYQGRTDALFFICGECAPESTVNDFPFDSGWTFINDLEWRGTYRMFSVAVNPKLAAARSFHVAAERIVALDSSIQSTGLRSAPIASARISY